MSVETLEPVGDDTGEPVQLVGTCPDCGHRLRAVFDGRYTRFRCRLCGACWGAAGNSVERIDPLACGRCRFRPLCLAQPDDHPLRAA